MEWVIRGQTLAELAQQLHIPAAMLAATVAHFNAYAECGTDPDFHRDPHTLGPLTKPPFYGVKLAAPPIATGVISLVTNPSGQVLHHATGRPISGLYACGQVVEPTRTLGVGYQAGCQLMRALIGGFLAAEHAAGRD